MEFLNLVENVPFPSRFIATSPVKETEIMTTLVFTQLPLNALGI